MKYKFKPQLYNNLEYFINKYLPMQKTSNQKEKQFFLILAHYPKTIAACIVATF